MSAFISKLSLRQLTLVMFMLVATVTPQATSAQIPTPAETCGVYTVELQTFGAGMMHQVTPIVTANQRVSYISPTENCAVVQWTSSTPTTSAVLYAELGDEPITIDPFQEGTFGYPHATTQNNAGASMHTAILTDLKPGVAYSYRLVNRSHPSAVPSISDPRVLIAGPAVVVPPTIPTTPITPPVVPSPTPAVTPPYTSPTPSFDWEKFPITPSTSEVSEKPVEMPAVTELEEDDTPATATATGTDDVPSALNAAAVALGSAQAREFKIWEALKDLWGNLLPSKERLSLTSHIGLFDKDRYIVPLLFFLGLLFLLQQLVFPAFGFTLKNPLLYWMAGAVIVAIVSALAMLYYITLIAIALFLALLAWYLLRNVSDDTKAITGKEEATLTVVKNDLKKIEGIGPKIEELLNKEGINTYTDLKRATQKQLKNALQKGGDKFLIHDPKTWPLQAELADSGKFKELKELQDSLQGGKRVEK